MQDHSRHNASTPLLKVQDLKTYFDTDVGVVRAVDGVDFEIPRGSTLGVVGESGCGKSITALSIMQLIPHPPGRIVEGTVWFHPKQATTPIDLLKLRASSPAMRSIRGKEIALIFQEPMTSLSPVHTIGNQIMEAIFLHRPNMGKLGVRELTLELLHRVRIPNPAQRIHEYPHQLSGGMRQRAMIAMALSCNPSLLVADEPTTAVDVTVQAQILNLLKELQADLGMAMMFITHDLGVIAHMAREVAVMYLGLIVERADVDSVFHSPKHPYTRALLKSIPNVHQRTNAPLYTIGGTVPRLTNVPKGCAFVSRCRDIKGVVCRGGGGPPSTEVQPGHYVRCFWYDKTHE